MDFFVRTMHNGFTQHFYDRQSSVFGRGGSVAVSKLESAFSKNSAGFTLIEVMVSLFIFLVIMMAVSQTFVGAFSGYRNARAVQRDTENVQLALNLLAKELRTSTVVFPSSGTPPISSQSVRFYDYSQATCFEYTIGTNQLTVDKYKPPSPSGDPFIDCAATSMPGTPTVVVQAGTTLGGRFMVTPSRKAAPPQPAVVGKVTVALQVGEGSVHTARIQTTSSLRDYGYIGL